MITEDQDTIRDVFHIAIGGEIFSSNRISITRRTSPELYEIFYRKMRDTIIKEQPMILHFDTKKVFFKFMIGFFMESYISLTLEKSINIIKKLFKISYEPDIEIIISASEESFSRTSRSSFESLPPIY